jgi:hypothetical protein
MSRMKLTVLAIVAVATVTLGCTKGGPQPARQMLETQVAEIRVQMEDLSARVQGEFQVDITDESVGYLDLPTERGQQLKRMMQRYRELEVHLSSKKALLDLEGKQERVEQNPGP